MPSVRYAWAIRSQNDGEDFGTIQNLDGPFSAQSSMFPKGEVRSVPAVLELLWVNEAGCLTAGGGAQPMQALELSPFEVTHGPTKGATLVLDR